jgi:hypothetical protein
MFLRAVATRHRHLKGMVDRQPQRPPIVSRKKKKKLIHCCNNKKKSSHETCVEKNEK